MDPRKLYRDRTEAGRRLAQRLRGYRDSDPIILGLPRGGVPVAYEVAHLLGAPLDVCVVRKIGAPLQPEYGIGAVAEDGARYVDREGMRMVGVTEHELNLLAEAKRAEVEDRVLRFRHGAPPLDVQGRTVIVVDDGVATGGTARAAMITLRARGAGKIVLAVPVGASSTLVDLASIADEVVCLSPEEDFYAVGLWYEDFDQTRDEEVIALLDRARSEYELAHGPVSERPPLARSGVVLTSLDRDVRIPLSTGWLDGRLTIPPGAPGLIVFAHGSGSSRLSSRNLRVAGQLQREGLGTLLFDLLTDDEARLDAELAHLRFDIDLLAARLVTVTDWILRQPEAADLRLGYYGASTGAAAAIVAAARRPEVIHALVSRGGRPDLAATSLSAVKAPTLLVVGSEDHDVLRLNRAALRVLTCEKALEIVPGATHLFEEPGTLDAVTRATAHWFVHHLGAHAREAHG